MRHRILFILAWMLVLGLAQASLDPTIGLLTVVACAVHIGLVLGRGGQPPTGFSLATVLREAGRVVGAPLRLPARLVRRGRCSSQAETIGIEVHLADRRRSAEIERRLRAALRQCARTWAPHPLPVGRITVHAGAPAEGRAQVYERWLLADDPKQESSASLVVISLGLVDAIGHPLDDLLLVGALATRVAALVTERYQRQHSDTPAADSVEAKPSVEVKPARPSRSPAADLVDPASMDQKLVLLMDRLRRQAGPLEPEQGTRVAGN
jgi:hypothetical protein